MFGGALPCIRWLSGPRTSKERVGQSGVSGVSCALRPLVGVTPSQAVIAIIIRLHLCCLLTISDPTAHCPHRPRCPCRPHHPCRPQCPRCPHSPCCPRRLCCPHCPHHPCLVHSPGSLGGSQPCSHNSATCRTLQKPHARPCPSTYFRTPAGRSRLLLLHVPRGLWGEGRRSHLLSSAWAGQWDPLGASGSPVATLQSTCSGSPRRGPRPRSLSAPWDTQHAPGTVPGAPLSSSLLRTAAQDLPATDPILSPSSLKFLDETSLRLG